MVALTKMSESRLRCLVCGVVCSDGLSRVSEEEDGVEPWAWNVVSSGCSIWRFARGEAGRPIGGICAKDDIVY